MKTSAKSRIPVYEIRLVQSRNPLLLAEPRASDSRTAARALHSLIGLTDREHLACLFVGAQGDITGAHVIAVGGQTAIGAIDVRVILRAALAACANALILGHNHPSGNPMPSNEDIASTAVIMRAANLLVIPVLDHVIVTRDEHRYYSMFDQGTLPAPSNP